MTKKVGRPKTATDKARAPGISIRLTQAEAQTIQKAVLASGLKKSDWVRKSLLHVATSDIRIT